MWIMTDCRARAPARGAHRRLLGACTDQPKSAIFSSPFMPSSRFSGLMSRWITCLEWQYTSARARDAMYLCRVRRNCKRHIRNTRAQPRVRAVGLACRGGRKKAVCCKRSAQGAADRGASRRGTKDSSHWQPAPRQDGRGAARGGARLVEAIAPLQLPVQLALCRILQDQVHAVLRRAPALGAQQRSYI